MDTQQKSSAGGWLAAAGLLLVAALLLHPPPETETAAFLELIAAEGDTWILAHWLGAASFALFAVTGLFALTESHRGGLARGAWGLLVVGASATLVTAVSEATVMAAAAAAGDNATFAVWERFAVGMSMGFVVMGVAVALIASHEARSSTPAVPRWTGGVAAVLALVSSAAWIAGAGLGYVGAAPVWLVSALLMTAWLIWYGIALVRFQNVQPRKEALHV